MARWLLVALAALVLTVSALAETRPFLEFWSNIAHYDTNVERKGFASLLARVEAKAGLYLLDTPLQIYGAAYTMTSQSPDYWDNSVFYGPGIRFKPFAGYAASGWLDAWLPDLKLFAESLSASYLKNAASGEANRRTDTRYGFDLWHEWNLDKPDQTSFWGELWSNLSNRSTNFSWTDLNGSVFYFQPKVGRHLGGGIEPYVKLDLVASDKPDYWLNNYSYGIGIRFEPWRSAFQPDQDSLLKKFKMFAEALSVGYLRDKPADPDKTVNSDVRFGIDFSYGR